MSFTRYDGYTIGTTEFYVSDGYMWISVGIKDPQKKPKRDNGRSSWIYNKKRHNYRK